MLLAAALGGQSGELAFENAARLEHLPRLKTVQRAQQAERGLAELWWPVRDECTHAVPDIHHAHRGEVADAGAQAGAADAQLLRELPLRRDLVAVLQAAGFDQGPDVVDHSHGHMRIGFRHGPSGGREPGGVSFVPEGGIQRTIRLFCLAKLESTTDLAAYRCILVVGPLLYNPTSTVQEVDQAYVDARHESDPQ